MKKKQIIALAAILIILIGIVVARQFEKPAELSTEEYSPLDLSFDSAAVQKLELWKGPKSKLVELAKTTEGWKIANFFNARVNEEKINQAMKQLQELKGELRATDKTLFEDFRINEEEAYRLNLLDQNNQTILSLFLGAKKPNIYDSVFIRKSDSDAVYLGKTDLFGYLGLWGDPEKELPKPDFWAHLSLLQLNVDSINSFESKKWLDGKEEVKASVLRTVDSVDSTKRKWKYVRPEVPFALDVEKLKQFLNIPNWKATKVLDPKEKDYGFDKPRAQIKLGMDGGSNILLTVGSQNTETKGHFVQVTNEPVFFEISDYYFKNFDVDDSRFFVDNPLAVEPDKTDRLVIHTSEKEWTFNPKQKKWDTLTAYLNDLKSFSLSRLLFDAKDKSKVKSPGRHWVEIKKEGEISSLVVDVGETIAENKEYAGRKRDNSQSFAISESVFKKTFENLDRLAEPKS